MASKAMKARDGRFLTRVEVARIFAVTPSTVSRWGREGRLPSVRTLGGQRRYVRDAVLSLAEEAGIAMAAATVPSVARPRARRARRA
jgi:excisionase family DNA binding protein